MKKFPVEVKGFPEGMKEFLFQVEKFSVRVKKILFQVKEIPVGVKEFSFQVKEISVGVKEIFLRGLKGASFLYLNRKIHLSTIYFLLPDGYFLYLKGKIMHFNGEFPYLKILLFIPIEFALHTHEDKLTVNIKLVQKNTYV